MTIDATLPLDTAQLPTFPAYLRARWTQLNNSYITYPLIFTVAGTLVAGANKAQAFPIRYDLNVQPTIVDCIAYVKTAPTGQSIIIDVNKNGSTIYTTQANRPTIAAAAQISTATVPDALTLTQSDILSVDVDQIGSGTAGADLAVVVLIKQKLIIL